MELEQDEGVSGRALPSMAYVTPSLLLRGDSGHDERTIADALGQKTIEMARHYAKGADLRSENARRRPLRSTDELNKRRTKTVKLDR